MHLQYQKQNPYKKGINIPKELSNRMMPDNILMDWATDQLMYQVSRQKPVLNSLLLDRIYELVKVEEKTTDTQAEMPDGCKSSKGNDGLEIKFPLLIPISQLTGTEKQKVAFAIANPPEHESQAYAFALQVIEWNILQSKKKTV